MQAYVTDMECLGIVFDLTRHILEFPDTFVVYRCIHPIPQLLAPVNVSWTAGSRSRLFGSAFLASYIYI